MQRGGLRAPTLAAGMGPGTRHPAGRGGLAGFACLAKEIPIGYSAALPPARGRADVRACGPAAGAGGPGELEGWL